MSKGIPFLAASVGSAKANRACGSMKRLTSHADAMRSMCGRGRVTHVLPEGGSAWWGCLVAARGPLPPAPRVDRVAAHRRRSAPRRRDLRDEPLEELDRLWRLRQDPSGALQLDRPHSLELPPDTDPVPRRRRRQAHQECEPTHSCYTR